MEHDGSNTSPQQFATPGVDIVGCEDCLFLVKETS